MVSSLKGRCACGAIAYEIDRVFDAIYCHCEQCRRRFGGPVYAGAVVESDAFRIIQGTPSAYARTDAGTAHFCGQCGSPLHYLPAGEGPLNVPIGTLDDPDAVVPSAHQWHGESLSWFETTDAQPRARSGELTHPAARSESGSVVVRSESTVTTPRRIIAMGGGGFSMEPDVPLLDEYVLDVARRRGVERPAVCFLPTASADAGNYVGRFYGAFERLDCEPTHLPLFRRRGEDLRSFLLGQDVIYVGGGNTVNMLAIWRAHRVDVILREAWERGIVLCGLSAGGICWFRGGVTDSFGPDLAPFDDGLALLSPTFCPHYDDEPTRRQVYSELLREGTLQPGYAAQDGVALLFEDEELVETVSSRAEAGAWRVDEQGVHEALSVRLL